MAERIAKKKLTRLLGCCHFSDIFYSTQDTHKEEEKEKDIDPVCLSKYH